MLRPQLVEKVHQGQFHIYAITRVEEGAELLLGTPTGVLGKNGHFPKQSLFGRIQERLETLADAARDSMPWSVGQV